MTAGTIHLASRGLCIPIFIPRTGANSADAVDGLDGNPQVSALHGRNGQSGQTTQIYEGTNQIQRVVMARQLLK